MSSHGWDSSELKARFLLYAGRGNGGQMQYDELWTATRVWEVLADAQEDVYADLVPRVPHVFVGVPVLLTSSDGGVTYDFADWPNGHMEVYAVENGGRELRGSSYGDLAGDFVFEGNKLRSPGNRVRTYANGPWARYSGFPQRLSASQEPTLMPYAARELILYKALVKAADVPAAMFDGAPWEKRYTEALKRHLINWQTQQAAPQAGNRSQSAHWSTYLSAFNG